MSASKNPLDQPAHSEFVISRRIDAPREVVWRACTEPALMEQWWGPQFFTIPVCYMNVRPGGIYRIVMRAPDGIDYPMKGAYREVAEPERLVFTMDLSDHPKEWFDTFRSNQSGEVVDAVGEIFATAHFEEQGGATRLTVQMLFQSAAVRDAMLKMGMSEGWSQSLARLVALLAKMDMTTGIEQRTKMMNDDSGWMP